MPDTFKVLGQAELAQAASTTTLYTVPADARAIVRNISVVNSTAGTPTVKLWVGGSADANLSLPTTTLKANGHGQWDGVETLEAGQTIVGQSDTASAVTVTVYGDEVT